MGKKELRVASVGLRLNDPRVLDLNFRSSQTWIDRDVLLLRLSEIEYEYSTHWSHGTYQGVRSLDEDDSVRIQADFRRRRAELLELLKLGRTVVVFLAPPTHWYVDTGERTYSGTGRNRQATRVVTSMQLYSLLPLATLQAAPASTSDLELVAAEPFAGFWRVMRGRFEAAARLTEPLGKATLKISGTDAAVSSIIRTKEGGIVILLPQDLLYYDEHARVQIGDNSPATNDAEDAADGKDMAEDADDTPEDAELDDLEDADEQLGPRVEDVEFLDALFELIRALRADAGDFEHPAWAERFSFEAERDAGAGLSVLEAAASDALAALDGAKSRLAELARRKTLITGTGKALEIVAQEAFEALGFSVEEGAPGRTDRIMRIDGYPPIVLETKGPAKSAAEADSAQLEKWVSEHFIAEAVQPKGALLANAWRDVPLSERADQAFPDQMLGYASSRGHCLITGTQLLGAWLDVEANPAKRAEIVQSLYDTVGRYSLYADWSEFLDADDAQTQDQEAGD